MLHDIIIFVVLIGMIWLAISFFVVAFMFSVLAIMTIKDIFEVIIMELDDEEYDFKIHSSILSLYRPNRFGTHYIFKHHTIYTNGYPEFMALTFGYCLVYGLSFITTLFGVITTSLGSFIKKKVLDYKIKHGYTSVREILTFWKKK